MNTVTVIPPDDITKCSLPCRHLGCGGSLRELTISLGLAYAQHLEATSGQPEVTAECVRCGKQNAYRYEEILSLLPPERRPRPLPSDFVYAIALVMLPRPEISDGDYFMGERLLVEVTDGSSEQWTGILKSASGLAPLLPVDSILEGGFMSGFTMICGYVDNEGSKPLPIELPEPGTLDTGFFCMPDNAPGTLLPANLFCSNPSCPHIFGPYYSQAVAMLEEHKDVGWFLGVDELINAFVCERCGMTRLVKLQSYNGLYKI